jgi:hypothetical protein
MYLMNNKCGEHRAMCGVFGSVADAGDPIVAETIFTRHFFVIIQPCIDIIIPGARLFEKPARLS